jgi:hypothetical protein
MQAIREAMKRVGGRQEKRCAAVECVWAPPSQPHEGPRRRDVWPAQAASAAAAAAGADAMDVDGGGGAGAREAAAAEGRSLAAVVGVLVVWGE